MAEVQKINTAQSGEMIQRFIEFVMMQSQHAALFLGQIPHPETGRPVVDLDTAAMFIGQLEMIESKTRGNLSQEESQILGNALDNLHRAFALAARGGQPGTPPSAPVIAPVREPAPEPAQVTTPAPAQDSRKKFTKSYGA